MLVVILVTVLVEFHFFMLATRYPILYLPDTMVMSLKTSKLTFYSPILDLPFFIYPTGFCLIFV